MSDQSTVESYNNLNTNSNANSNANGNNISQTQTTPPGISISSQKKMARAPKGAIPYFRGYPFTTKAFLERKRRRSIEQQRRKSLDKS